MKKTTLWLFAIIWLWTLVLTGCNKSENPSDENQNQATQEEIGYSASSEYTKTSLTIGDLDSIDETNFPKSYSYSSYNMTENVLEDEWEYTYPEDISHTLLIPEHATMVSREVISSWIEDEMIYTVTKVELQDGTQINVLYINNPVTLNYVAASVQNGNISKNYQFAY